jgi:hypothetical protein
MVDIFGRWTYEPNTPEGDKCDCDRIADWILESGYKVKTSIERLVTMIILHFDCPDNYGECDEDTGFGYYGDSFTIEGCKQFVEDSGGFAEFDYDDTNSGGWAKSKLRETINTMF